MQYSQNSSKAAHVSTPFTLAGLVLLCLLFFLWGLDAYTLFDRTETETAEVARQMWVSGDWITPYFNGIRYFDKPVLLYWLIGLGFQIFGQSELAVRLPSALFATGLVVATWLFARRLAGPRVALLAATMLMANPFVFGLGRTGVTDMGLACFVSVGLYCWYWGYVDGHSRSYLAAFACLGGALLIKGPIGLVLPGFIVVLFLACTGRWRSLTRVPWVAGIALMLAIALPWYGLVVQANGWDFIDKFFIHHNVDRFLSVVDRQPGPWYYYLLFTPAGFFPWIVLLPLALLRPEARRWLSLPYWRERAPEMQLGLFLAIWFAAWLVFLSTAVTKLPHYILPALPALAVLAACAWETQLRDPGRALKPTLAFVALVLAALAVGFWIAPGLITDPSLPDLRARIEATGAPTVLAVLFAGAACAVLVGLVRERLLWIWATCLTTYGLFFSAAIVLLMPTVEVLVHAPLLDLAAYLHRAARPDVQIATFGVYAPSLNYYGQLNRIPVYEKRPQMLYEMAKPQHILLVTTQDRLSEKQLDLSAFPVVHTAGIYRVYDLPPRAATKSSVHRGS